MKKVGRDESEVRERRCTKPVPCKKKTMTYQGPQGADRALRSAGTEIAKLEEEARAVDEEDYDRASVEETD